MKRNLIFVLFLNILAAPLMAAIAFQPANPLPGQDISFTIQQSSLLAFNVLSWDFGDRTIRAVNNRTIQHTYNQAGSYTVKVRFKYLLGSDVLTETQVVNVNEHRQIVAAPDRGQPGQSVSFQALNFFSEQLSWDFGDGHSARTGHSASHVYGAPGTYPVRVREQSGDNPVTISKTVIIADNRTISVSPAAPAPGQKVNFKAQNHVADCVLWNFGDGSGNIRGTQAISHSYSRPGTYPVSARDYCGDAQPVTVNVTVKENRRIEFQPSPARAGEPVNFTARNFASPCIVWQFSDGGAPVSGQAAQAHTFANPGSYRVAAIDDCGRGGAPRVELTVVVDPGVQPAPSLLITHVHLHFEDESARKQVTVEERNLQAVADLQYQGTGSLMLEWLVDGQPLAGQTLPLTAAGQSTLKSGLTPPLPTRAPGRHRVTLRLLSPRQALQIPTIEYTVIPATPLSQGPRVTSVSPSVIHQDREYLLKLKGENFDSQTRFDPGAGIAPRGQPLIVSSQEAELKVFASREISEGLRLIKAWNAQGDSTGPGKLFVERLSETLSNEISLPCPDVSQIQKMLIQGLRPDSYYSSSGEQNRSDPH
ncbi:MAG: PKD domain-containing protein, partial [Acidobacteria bacterium]|nr:PKD domain-containing protein [Acidobacteriota bacterium]